MEQSIGIYTCQRNVDVNCENLLKSVVLYEMSYGKRELMRNRNAESNQNTESNSTDFLCPKKLFQHSLSFRKATYIIRELLI